MQSLALGLISVAILRYGLLVTTVMVLFDNIPSGVPMVVIAFAIFGFYAARAGQPLLGRFDG